MKSARKFAILSIITLALSSFNTYGQTAAGKTIPEWLQKEVNKVTTVITDLNAEQQSKLANAIQTRSEALAKVNSLKEGGASADEVKGKTTAAWTDYNHEAKAILTDAQFEKFKDLHKPKSAASNQ